MPSCTIDETHPSNFYERWARPHLPTNPSRWIGSWIAHPTPTSPTPALPMDRVPIPHHHQPPSLQVLRGRHPSSAVAGLLLSPDPHGHAVRPTPGGQCWLWAVWLRPLRADDGLQPPTVQPVSRASRDHREVGAPPPSVGTFSQCHRWGRPSGLPGRW